jgi:hypothetical protein
MEIYRHAIIYLRDVMLKNYIENFFDAFERKIKCVCSVLHSVTPHVKKGILTLLAPNFRMLFQGPI